MYSECSTALSCGEQLAQFLEGREIEPGRPDLGRWLPTDVDCFLDEVWQRTDLLLPIARLDELPTIGNRHNVFLAVVTTAAFDVLRSRGVAREHGMTLVGDVGWKVYAAMLRVAAFPWRSSTRDPQQRIERTLRALMVFPFSAPGRPPTGDDEVLEAFRRSWCR